MEIAVPVLAVTATLLLAVRLVTDALFRRKGVYHSAAERTEIIEETTNTQIARHRATLRLNAVADKNELLDNLELALRLREQGPPSSASASGDPRRGTAETVASIERQLADAERETRQTVP